MSEQVETTRIEKPTEDPKPPEQPADPVPPGTPGGGSVTPGGSPGETQGVDSPLKDAGLV